MYWHQCDEWYASDSRPDNMSYDDFEKSIEEQIGLVEVKLQGMGEPLLNPDFFRMVQLAVERDIWVRTTTNGSLLNQNENYKRMIDSKIGEIQVSIDGATKETFESIRVGSDFEKVVSNVTMMNEYANSKGEAWRTSCWMLVQEDNQHEMEATLELAAKMGFVRFTYSIAIGSWGKENWEEINAQKEVKDILTDERVTKLISRGKELGVEVTFWDGKDKYQVTEESKKLCGWLFERAFISSSMRIVPCCVISDSNTYDLGNALNFTREWNSSKYQKLREEHLEGRIPKMCQNCYGMFDKRK